jgi:hypothetical protein
MPEDDAPRLERSKANNETVGIGASDQHQLKNRFSTNINMLQLKAIAVQNQFPPLL